MQDNPKNLERNSTSKIQSILNRLEEGEKQIQYAKDSNIVLVLGNTGAGKSTFVQYIAGNNHHLISEEVDDTGDYRIKDTNNKIGSSLIASQTEIPELVFDVKTNTTFYDCPGFSDTRNAEHDISGTYFIKKIIDHAKAVKLVFIVNYFSVQPYRDKSDFMLLTNHATSMIKNIDKFKGGIVIVASKVNDVKPDIKIIKTVANFLTRIEAELKNNSIYLQQDELKQNKTIKAVQFIDALLTNNSTNGEDYLRIGFIKQPKEPGPLSNITEMQNHKKSLEKLLHENIQYIQYDARDFGYTVSADSQIYIGNLLEAIHKNILSCVQNVSSTVEAYYNDLAHNMLDKMHSFVNSTITVKIETNISEAQLFSAQLKNGYETISKLSTEVKNISSTKELAQKINDSIHALDINISQSVVSDILKQGEYLEFFRSVSQLKSTEPLKQLELASSIQTALQTIFESSNFIQGNATAVANQIKSNIKSNIAESGIEIQNYFSDKEKTMHDISELCSELGQGYSALSNKQKSPNEIVAPEACIQKVMDAVNNLNITSTDIAAKHNLSNTIKYGGYLSFLNQVSTQSLINEFKCTDGLANVIKYLDHSQKWYDFLQKLYNKLSEYDIQRNTTEYDTKNLGVGENKTVSKTNLSQFLKNVYKTDSESEYNFIKDVTLDRSKIDALEHVLNFTLKHDVDEICPNSNTTLVIKRHYVKLSDIITCNATKSITIYALKTVFIDTDLNRIGNQTKFAIIAPTWDIQGTPKIILDGELGKAHNSSQANNGISPGAKGDDGKPGKPGGPGGNFLGIGETFINAQSLTISSNGGKGGSGQNGGNGRNGTDGRQIPKYKEASRYDNTDFAIERYAESFSTSIRESSARITEKYRLHVCDQQNCNNGGDATDGGIGGVGGFGGNPGSVIIIDLPNKYNNVISIINKVGNIGKVGCGGHGGKAGEISQCIDVHVMRDSAMFSTKESVDFFGGGTFKCKSGKSGVSGKNDKNIEKAKQIKSIDVNIINDYKSYLRENLHGSIIESSLRKFILDVENKTGDLYDTLGFVHELHSLESQFHKLKELPFLPFYKSLLNRISKYAENPKNNEKSDEYKKVLSYLYTATLSKIHSIKHDLDNDLVINIKSMLDLTGKELIKWQNFDVTVQKNKYKAAYQEKIDIKIKEAEQFIEQDVVNEIENIIDATNNQIHLLIDETIVLQDQSRDAIKELQEKKSKLEQQLVLRKILGGLQIASQFLAFTGPVGATASATIGAATMTTQTLALDNTGPLGTDKTAILPSGVSKRFTQITDMYKLKQSHLKTALDKLEQNVANYKRDNPLDLNTDFLKRTTNKISNIRQQIKEAEKNGIISDSTYVAIQKDLAEHVEKEKDILKGIKPEKDKNIDVKLKIYMNVQIGVSAVEITVDVFSKIQNNEAKINILDKAISEESAKLNALKQYEQNIYAIIIPVCKAIEDEIKNTYQELQGKSHVALDISKWKIQSIIKDVQVQILKMTKGYNVEEDFARCIEKLENGISIMIQLYDSIQKYQDDAEFADYIANISSDNANKIIINNNKELSDAIDDLKLVIQSNLVLREYEKAINAFQQYIFPFADLYLAEFNLPPHLSLNNTISVIVDKITNIANKLQKDTATINQVRHVDVFPSHKFDSKTPQTKPFFVWKYDTNKEAISRLLQGQEITIRADIKKGFLGNAVKFKEIGVYFKLANTAMQNSLDEQLKHFSLEMIHLGNSYYRCDNKFYVMTHANQTIIHSIMKSDRCYNNENEVYTMIRNKDNDPVLSPYTMWKIKLTNGDLDKLRKYQDQVMDLELEGSGQYVALQSQICNNNLEKYYKIDDIILDIDMSLHGEQQKIKRSVEHQRDRREINSDDRLEKYDNNGLLIADNVNQLSQTRYSYQGIKDVTDHFPESNKLTSSSASSVKSVINTAIHYLISRLEVVHLFNSSLHVIESLFINLQQLDNDNAIDVTKISEMSEQSNWQCSYSEQIFVNDSVSNISESIALKSIECYSGIL